MKLVLNFLGLVVICIYVRLMLLSCLSMQSSYSPEVLPSAVAWCSDAG
jgi:hypothetical protein